MRNSQQQIMTDLVTVFLGVREISLWIPKFPQTETSVQDGFVCIIVIDGRSSDAFVRLTQDVSE